MINSPTAAFPLESIEALGEQVNFFEQKRLIREEKSPLFVRHRKKGSASMIRCGPVQGLIVSSLRMTSLSALEKA